MSLWKCCPCIIKEDNYIPQVNSPQCISLRRAYATYKDDTYTSAVRTELLDTIENPVMPNPVIKRIELLYNDNATWETP